MSVKPIIFSGPMVKALLAGTKTQTRRLVKPQPEQNSAGLWCWPPPDEYPVLVSCKRYGGFCQADGEGLQYFLTSDARRLPYAPGDLLYVREAFWQTSRYPFTMPCGEASPQSMNWGSRRHYAVDGAPENTPNRHYPNGLKGGAIAAPDPDSIWVKRPSIHMPRWASRMTPEVTNVRVQRVQNISEEDARAEGITDGGCITCGNPEPCGCANPTPSARESFADLWDSLHGEGAWQANPWVAAYTFSVHHCNVDDLLRQREAQ